MARAIEFIIGVDVREVDKFLGCINPMQEKIDVWVHGVQGVKAIFNVSYTKAEQLIKGVLKPSIIRDEKGHIAMHLPTALNLYYKEIWV